MSFENLPFVTSLVFNEIIYIIQFVSEIMIYYNFQLDFIAPKLPQLGRAPCLALLFCCASHLPTFAIFDTKLDSHER